MLPSSPHGGRPPSRPARGFRSAENPKAPEKNDISQKCSSIPTITIFPWEDWKLRLDERLGSVRRRARALACMGCVGALICISGPAFSMRVAENARQAQPPHPAKAGSNCPTGRAMSGENSTGSQSMLCISIVAFTVFPSLHSMAFLVYILCVSHDFPFSCVM